MKGGKDSLYEDLKRQILTMELDPDTDLDEASLCERYGLSRTPVRETFRRLAGEGYVEIRENRGTRVSPMSHATLRQFFLVAPMVYAAIGRLAVQNFKPKQLVELKDTQERFRAATDAQDALAMVLENNRFHEIMGEMSGNAYLQPSLGRLLIDHARIGHTFFRPRDAEMHRRLGWRSSTMTASSRRSPRTTRRPWSTSFSTTGSSPGRTWSSSSLRRD